MQIKEYFKGIAYAALNPVVKSLSSGTSYRGINNFIQGNPFIFDLHARTAYNNKIYYSAANLIVGKLIEPNLLFNKKSSKAKDKSHEAFYSKSISNERRALIKATTLDELDEHPLKDLFDSPNDYQSGIELMEDFWHNYLFGDGFLYFETNGSLSRNNAPIAIHSLDRDSVECVQSQDMHSPISHYIFTGQNGRQLRIERDQMLHLKRWNNDKGDLKGLGINKVVARDIALNDANVEAQGAAYRNGGRGVLFSSKVDVTAEGKVIGKLAKEQVVALQEKVNRDMSGALSYICVREYVINRINRH